MQSGAPKKIQALNKMSVIRSLAQIPPSVKYLIVALDSGRYNSDDLSTYPAFTITVPNTVADLGGSIVDSASVNENLDIVNVVTFGGQSDYDIGTQFKDLGRQFLIKGADDNHVALFRQVQWVNGTLTEGVGGSAPSWNCLFVKVWSADGNNVCVVRTGPGSPA